MEGRGSGNWVAQDKARSLIGSAKICFLWDGFDGRPFFFLRCALDSARNFFACLSPHFAL
jgi:hypothetical protein